jgi:mRNA interferase RelE/StbE
MPCKLRVPDDVATFVRNLHPILKKRIKQTLKTIMEGPYCGKLLKDDLSELRSFRVKKFRIIYKMLSKTQIGIVTVGPRRSIYEETFRIISREQKDKR